MRRVAGRLRLDLAQYRELATFAQLGTSDLDAATRRQLDRGQRTVEILKQAQFVPQAVEEQVIVLFAVTNGYLDEVAVDQASRWEQEFQRFLRSNYPEIGDKIRTTGLLDEDTEASLSKAIGEFQNQFSA